MADLMSVTSSAQYENYAPPASLKIMEADCRGEERSSLTPPGGDPGQITSA